MVVKTGSVKKSSNQPTHFEKKTLILYIHTYSWRYILDIPRLSFVNYITKNVLFFPPKKLMYLRLFLLCATSTSQSLTMGHMISPTKSHGDRPYQNTTTEDPFWSPRTCSWRIRRDKNMASLSKARNNTTKFRFWRFSGSVCPLQQG